MVLLKNIFALFVRAVLSLRYRFHWRGLDRIKSRRGILFLPNHPGELDPVFITARLWRRFQPRGVAVEDFFYMPGVNLLMRLINGIPMPNVSQGGSAYQRRRVDQALDEVCESLKRGENVLIYPAGRMMRGGLEEVRGASAVHDILQRVPDANVVLLRSRGFLGSTFSWALHQRRPDLGKALKNGILWTIVNLFLFNPRRSVTVDVEEVTDAIPRDADKMTLNRWLEDWYNKPGKEELSLVSLCRWWRKVPTPVEPKQAGARSDVEIDDEVKQKVTAEIADIARTTPDDVTEGMTLTGDLGFDSLNTADLIGWLEEEFFVTDIDPADLTTVKDVMAAAVGAVSTDTVEAPTTTPKGWAESGTRPELVLPDPDRTIQMQFLETCDRHPNAVAIADDTSVLTYKRMKLGALILAEVIREQIKEDRVGIMLPATAGANVVMMATLLANKVPVMINWTLGDANLEHVLEISGISRIITSGRFLDRLDQLNFDILMDYLITIEEWRREQIGWRAKLRAMLRAGKSPDAVCRLFGCDRVKPDDIGVILFTSGSESRPKGVPLSQRNMLADIRGAVPFVGLKPDDSLHAFLPPFHSFGFIVTGIFPMLAGLKTVYYPNPTDSRKLALGIATWKTTATCGTPTFIAGILRVATTEQLQSLRLVVCGAEKTPADLFKAADDLDIEVLEGYGITETGPVLTLNETGKDAVGVGKPIGGVELRIVGVDDRRPLETGERGLILARGPNVFSGYLGRDSSDAFQELNGDRYYVTGDLGFLDDRGYLTLAGRLKRFVKVAGEMVSLPAMEAAIAAHWPNEEGVVRTAVSAYEVEGERPTLCLFSSFEVSTDDVNAVLKEAGFANLVRVSKVIRLDEIPILGTGKTDYQALKRRLAEALDRE